ncbi:MAG TPA: hypothetical protein VHL34_22420 [Rhizomicrobium sp.]|jgi:hypothetical protein|nr:hypothetical protein [Rhizomicrobium sp.]
MIVRAIFWIAVVSFFMPREPDLGFGHPGNADGIAGLIQNAQGAASATVKQPCGEDAALCAAGETALAAFQGVAVNSLAEVKADIEASRHKRFAQLAARD